MGLDSRKPVFGGLRTAKAQTSLRIRLCYPLLKSIISELATSEISIFYLVSVADQAVLNLALLETPKTGFVTTGPKYKYP